MLEGRRIVLGVTGGIAAYKAVEVCRLLIKLGAHVVPVMTNAATNMVGETTLTALASEPVKKSIWNDVDPIPHTKLGQNADLILVCPATARILSDYRTGRSADLLAATLIATRAPVVLCPAMHTEMWEHPAVQDNIATLVERGVVIVPPEEGRLAGGDIGAGRLADPQTVVNAVVSVLTSANVNGTRPGATSSARPTVLNRLAGRSVVITAGGTREPIDPIRFLGNRSTGKQGHALASEAAALGAAVTLITTSSLPSPPGVARVDVQTASEMRLAVQAVASDADVLIMAAAVADFRPATTAATKIKKSDGVPSIELEPTTDILAELGQTKPAGQILVGFAAETNDLDANAADKLQRKGADLLVANDVSAPGVGFAHDTNEVTIFEASGGKITVPLASKTAIARTILESVAQRLS